MTAPFRNRLLGAGLCVVLLAVGAPLWLHSSADHAIAADAPANEGPAIPTELLDAIRSLKDFSKTPDNDARKAGRKKVYGLLAEKPDVRLIPVITAYKDGTLLLQGDHFATVGERVSMTVNGEKVSVAPLVDLLNGSTLQGPDGKPIYIQKISGAVAAPYKEKASLSELLSGMSLFDPNPKARIASIRNVSERAARSFIDISEQTRFSDALKNSEASLKADKVPDSLTPLITAAITAVDAALAEKPSKPISPVPGKASSDKAISAIKQVSDALAALVPASTGPAATSGPATNPTTAASTPAAHLIAVLHDFSNVARDYGSRLENQEKAIDELPKFAAALKRQYDKDPKGPYGAALKEAIAGTDAALGNHGAQVQAAQILGDIGTSRAANILQRLFDSAHQAGDTELEKATAPALAKANRHQTMVGFVQNTFFGLSAGSILVLLALGLSIIFGLMGVINMAHGEFMMIGAFTTYVVSEGFKHLPHGCYDYYLIAAIPAAFLVAGLCGFLCEYFVIRHLYGRPLETLLATFGVGLTIIWAVRKMFGDSVSVTPPRWMEGDIEIVPDLNLQLNRIYIILYCAICISVVYFIVNRTKLGLLLRATTQNREMAAALGVATRRIDGITFAIGAGLAGLAGVAVPLYNKINPQVGQEYIVDCFMVVVVGGVGKLAGAIWAGMGLGFITKYLEPVLQNIKSLASGASVFGRVIVLAMIVVFLQFRPSGLFPPKGRNADA